MNNSAMRTDPYKQFKFRLSIGGVVIGGFHHAKGITKITGLNKSTDVTLKRGVIAAKAFNDWLNTVRRGRTVTVGPSVLRGARLVKYTAAPLNSKGTDIAIEELVLAYERLEIIPAS